MAEETVELTAYQRGAVVMAALLQGKALTTTEVMKLTGLKRSGALKMMGHLSGLREVAVYEEERGVWRVLR